MSKLFNWIAGKISGFTNIDKAIAAFLGAFGVQLDWASFANSIDWSAGLSALTSGGLKAALLALIPGFLSWLALNKNQRTVKPGDVILKPGDARPVPADFGPQGRRD